MMMYGGYGMMSVFGLIGMIAQLVIFVLVIFLIVAGIKKVSEFQPHQREDRSLDILRERYAKGEITEEEFKKMKKDLMD
ncbi:MULTISPECIES: SHOCT domain-containing protein [Heyndrickxia]|uniref:SHOCT domain-containing protein n=1 Tax=Heyndrickxia TaxID=2837504 RepID=UPI001B7D064E|nr:MULTISPECIES: SHOCT domain-containing protein [Heyndrickxia]MEC2304238.1 SHOCT domain-containing protein [Weizmannia sp. CD-2023]MEC2340401.1 SHOCT domain-containing protein [Weizmannia sp. CD-2023]